MTDDMNKAPGQPGADGGARPEPPKAARLREILRCIEEELAGPEAEASRHHASVER